MTPPPRKYAEAPGMARSAAEMSPPADDSATATVCFCALRRAPTADAIPLRSFMAAPSPTSRSSISLGVRVRARRIAESRDGIGPDRDASDRPRSTTKDTRMPINGAHGIKQVGYFDCAGGGQVVVDGTVAFIAHMHAPEGTTIVDVSDPVKDRKSVV